MAVVVEGGVPAAADRTGRQVEPGVEPFDDGVEAVLPELRPQRAREPERVERRRRTQLTVALAALDKLN